MTLPHAALPEPGQVLPALTEAAVDGKRLSSFGNDPYAPLSANTTGDGRAKNRRVGLLAQGTP